MNTPAVTRRARGSRLLRAAGFAVAHAFRLVPTKWRFRSAIVAARWLEPLIAATDAYQERARLGTDDLRETSLELLLLMLTRHKTPFDPVLHIEGGHHLPSPATGATLIVGSHTMLSTLFIRHLEDAGHEPLVLTADPAMGVPGTRVAARVLCPSPALLFKVRRSLKEGRTLAGMIDRAKADRRSSSIETAAGSRFVSDALLRLALRYRARVVFIETRLDESSRVVVRLSAPTSACTSVAGIVDAFVDFVGASGTSGRRTSSSSSR